MAEELVKNDLTEDIEIQSALKNEVLQKPVRRTMRAKIADFFIGFFGWWILNILLWILIIGSSSDGLVNSATYLSPLINILILGVLAFSPRWRWLSVGAWAAFGVNILASVLLGNPVFVSIPAILLVLP